jgi:molybdopterin converting factor small subunit
MVTVLLFGHALREAVEDSEFQFKIAGPMTVRGLLEANQEKLAGITSLMNRGEVLVTVNRKVASLDSTVQDGDTIKLTHQPNTTYEGAMWQNP